jgi:hypothetical protein
MKTLFISENFEIDISEKLACIVHEQNMGNKNQIAHKNLSFLPTHITIVAVHQSVINKIKQLEL